MKSRIPIRIIALLMCVLLFSSQAVFATDYDGHWAQEYIESNIGQGWMTPDATGNIRPEDAMTRGDFASSLWKSKGSQAPTADNPFTDVSPDSVNLPAIISLYEQDTVLGYGGGLYGPDDPLTREMAAVLFARAFEITSQNPDAYLTFKDAADISQWAREAVSALFLKSYMVGVEENVFSPKGTLTRGQMARLLMVVVEGEGADISDGSDGGIGEGEDTGTGDADGMVITLTPDDIRPNAVQVTVKAEVNADSDITYIGYRTSTADAKYENKTGFSDITAKGSFTTTANGWFAVCAEDSEGNLAFKLINITNVIPTRSGGGYSYGGSGGGGGSSGTPTVPPTVPPGTVTDSGITVSGKLDGEQSYYVVENFDQSAASLVIPSNINGVPVKEIGEGAFNGSAELTEVTLPVSITAIREGAFSECTALVSINIPDSVTTVEPYAFYGCEALTAVSVGQNVTTVPEWAFLDCGAITSITIGSNVKSINANAFWGCDGLTAVTIPSSITAIGDNAFRNCVNLETVVFLGETPSIGLNAFKNTKYIP